ncbi:MAG: hypothetical protein GX458_21455 [Phyllobacteriaceae bacterium]|nr:hypothetical protein [Phyllobacteriaceae bacterium]
MPRRNRVTPFGTLEATTARGALMGNRGDLHGADGAIVREARPDVLRRICCTLAEGPGGPVRFDTPGRYTPLFFADEAVALAAGHRPCARCRRPAFERFVAAWRRAGGIAEGVAVRADEIDRALDAARRRVEATGHPRTPVADLPDGTFVLRDGDRDAAHLVRAGGLHRWRWEGYDAAIAPEAGETVAVLTPAPLVAVLRAGYRPFVPAFAGDAAPSAG